MYKYYINRDNTIIYRDRVIDTIITYDYMYLRINTQPTLGKRHNRSLSEEFTLRPITIGNILEYYKPYWDKTFTKDIIEYLANVI